MRHNTNVHGTQANKPASIEMSKNETYLRWNIHKEQISPEGEEPYEVWTYDEDILTASEYYELLALNYTIPDDVWDEGLQEANREARYRRWDGAEQSTRRKIELGIDVEANQTKLKEILDYKQAVNETKNQAGYPTNVPVWPVEPEFTE